MKRKTFYSLSLTWGLPMTAFGGLMALILLAAGRKPRRFGGCWVFEVGRGYSAFTAGLFVFCGSHVDDELLTHEHGHALQNCYLGPAMPLLSLCSIARFWGRSFLTLAGKKLSPYDAWWFEGQATALGSHYIRYF